MLDGLPMQLVRSRQDRNREASGVEWSALTTGGTAMPIGLVYKRDLGYLRKKPPSCLLPFETCEKIPMGELCPIPGVRQSRGSIPPPGSNFKAVNTMKHPEMSLMANWCMWHKFRGFEWNARPGAQRPLSISMANDRRRNH